MRLPFRAWDADRVAAVAADSRGRAERPSLPRTPLAPVTRLSEVPETLVSTRWVSTRLERPRSLDDSDRRRPWFPQLERAFLLHLPGAWIGDGVLLDEERFYGMGRWWLGRPEAYSAVRDVTSIRAGVSVTGWGGEAFQHFVLDALPALACVLELCESPQLEHLRIVSHRDGSEVAQWFWRRLGLEDRVEQKPVCADERRVVRAEELALFPQFEPDLGRLAIYPRGILAPVQHRLRLLEGGVRDRVVYLSRRGWEREVVERDDILETAERALRGSGLKLEVFEASGDLDRDAALMREARVLVGPHGGALANMALAPPGAHVIELAPIFDLYEDPEGMQHCYWGLAQGCSHHYWTVRPERYHFTDPIQVNPEAVARVLTRIVETELR